MANAKADPRRIKWVKRDDGLVMGKWRGRHINILESFPHCWSWCRMWLVPDGKGKSWRWCRGRSATLAQAKRAACAAAEIAEPIAGSF